jgi:hypothetical protein
LFTRRHGFVGFRQLLVLPRLDLDKNNSAIAAVVYDQVNFASIATKVASDRRKTFSRQKLFATSLPPSAKPFRIGKQPSSKSRQPEQSIYRLTFNGSMFASTLSQSYSLAFSVPEEVKLGPTGLSASDSLYVNNVRRMQRETSLNTLVTENATNGKVFVNTATATGNDSAAEYLDTLLVTLFDHTMNVYRITDLKIRNFFLRLKAGTFNKI